MRKWTFNFAVEKLIICLERKAEMLRRATRRWSAVRIDLDILFRVIVCGLSEPGSVSSFFVSFPQFALTVSYFRHFLNVIGYFLLKLCDHISELASENCSVIEFRFCRILSKSFSRVNSISSTHFRAPSEKMAKAPATIRLYPEDVDSDSEDAPLVRRMGALTVDRPKKYADIIIDRPQIEVVASSVACSADLGPGTLSALEAFGDRPVFVRMNPPASTQRGSIAPSAPAPIAAPEPQNASVAPSVEAPSSVPPPGLQEDDRMDTSEGGLAEASAASVATSASTADPAANSTTRKRQRKRGKRTAKKDRKKAKQQQEQAPRREEQQQQQHPPQQQQQRIQHQEAEPEQRRNQDLQTQQRKQQRTQGRQKQQQQQRQSGRARPPIDARQTIDSREQRRVAEEEKAWRAEERRRMDAERSRKRDAYKHKLQSWRDWSRKNRAKKAEEGLRNNALATRPDLQITVSQRPSNQSHPQQQRQNQPQAQAVQHAARRRITRPPPSTNAGTSTHPPVAAPRVAAPGWSRASGAIPKTSARVVETRKDISVDRSPQPSGSAAPRYVDYRYPSGQGVRVEKAGPSPSPSAPPTSKFRIATPTATRGDDFSSSLPSTSRGLPGSYRGYKGVGQSSSRDVAAGLSSQSAQPATPASVSSRPRKGQATFGGPAVDKYSASTTYEFNAEENYDKMAQDALREENLDLRNQLKQQKVHAMHVAIEQEKKEDRLRVLEAGLERQQRENNILLAEKQQQVAAAKVACAWGRKRLEEAEAAVAPMPTLEPIAAPQVFEEEEEAPIGASIPAELQEHGFLYDDADLDFAQYPNCSSPEEDFPDVDKFGNPIL